MTRLYNSLRTKNSFPLVILFISFLIFFILQPKVSSNTFNFKRERVLMNFLDEINKSNNIDPKSYWKFREFYSPGHFTYNEEFVKVSSILEFKKLYKDKNEFLFFESEKLQSKDSIINSNDLNNYVQSNEKKMLSKGEDYAVFKEDEDIKIVFIKSIDEMMEANGLFDYTSQERKLLQDKYWLNETQIKTN